MYMHDRNTGLTLSCRSLAARFALPFLSSFRLVLPSFSHAMDPNISHLALQIADLLRDNPQGNGSRANVLGPVAGYVAAPTCGAPFLNFDSPEIFPEF